MELILIAVVLVAFYLGMKLGSQDRRKEKPTPLTPEESQRINEKAEEEESFMAELDAMSRETDREPFYNYETGVYSWRKKKPHKKD